MEEDIKTKLGLYRERCARLKLLEGEIEYKRYRISELEKDIPKGAYEPPMLRDVKSQTYDDMPKGQVLYGTLEGNPGYDEPEQLKLLRAELNDLMTEAYNLARDQMHIEAALGGLSDKTRMVIMLSYIDSMPWVEVCKRVNRDYGVFPSRRWIEAQKASGLAVMAKIMNINDKCTKDAQMVHT